MVVSAHWWEPDSLAVGRACFALDASVEHSNSQAVGSAEQALLVEVETGGLLGRIVNYIGLESQRLGLDSDG